MTIEDVIKKSISATGIYGILVLDDKNNYESQWTDGLGSGGYLLPDFHLEYIKCG